MTFNFTDEEVNRLFTCMADVLIEGKRLPRCEEFLSLRHYLIGEHLRYCEVAKAGGLQFSVAVQSPYQRQDAVSWAEFARWCRQTGRIRWP